MVAEVIDNTTSLTHAAFPLMTANYDESSKKPSTLWARPRCPDTSSVRPNRRRTIPVHIRIGRRGSDGLGPQGCTSAANCSNALKSKVEKGFITAHSGRGNFWRHRRGKTSLKQPYGLRRDDCDGDPRRPDQRGAKDRESRVCAVKARRCCAHWQAPYTVMNDTSCPTPDGPTVHLPFLHLVAFEAERSEDAASSSAKA